jgi:hypothetical protein
VQHPCDLAEVRRTAIDDPVDRYQRYLLIAPGAGIVVLPVRALVRRSHAQEGDRE